MSMHTILYSVVIILVIAGVTMFTRFGSFLIFGRGGRVPRIVSYLGGAMPAAVIAMLILYCLRGTTFSAWPFGLPEILACAATALLHWFGKNSLLSIGGGTALYMVLIQFVFQ